MVVNGWVKNLMCPVLSLSARGSAICCVGSGVGLV